ncbi:MAG: hypothetical protein WC967_15545 [Balneolaceae bacterium]
MANRFYNTASTEALSPYESAATAATTLADIITAAPAAGEIVWVDTASNETTGTAPTFLSPTSATPDNPQKIFCVSDFATTPATLATGAKLYAGSNLHFQLGGDWHFTGVEIGSTPAGGSLGGGNITLGNNQKANNLTFENCKIVLGSTSSIVAVKFGPNFGTSVQYTTVLVKNTSFKLSNTGQKIGLNCGSFVFDNIALDTASSTPEALFKVNGLNKTIVKNSDFSNKTLTAIVDASVNQTDFTIENCKLPAGCEIISSTMSTHSVVTMINCDSGDTSYSFAKYTYGGSIVANTTVYADNNPLKDKSTAVSNKFTSTENASYTRPVERTYMIPITGSSVGVAITPYVEFLVDGDGAAVLTNKDVVLKAELLADAASTLGSEVTSYPGIINSASTIASGSTTYTGDAFAVERTHRLSTAQITPAQAGFVKLTVQLLKPSTVIYVGVVGVV